MEQEKKGLSIASLIFGIAGILLCSFGFIPSLVGLIMAIVAKKKNQAGPQKVGLITSIVGLVISLIAGIVFIIVIATVGIGGISSALAGGTEPEIEPTYSYPVETDDPYEYVEPVEDPYGDIVVDPVDDPYGDIVVPDDGEGQADVQNDYVRLYQLPDGSAKIVLDNTFPSYGVFDYYGCDLSDIYLAINGIMAETGYSPVSVDLFYEFITVAMADDSFLSYTDENAVNNAEVEMAAAIQAASIVSELCPDAHVEYATVTLNDMVYTVYLDNGTTVKYNVIPDSTLEGYPYYILINYNGTDFSNYRTINDLSVFLLGIEMWDEFQ